MEVNFDDKIEYFIIEIPNIELHLHLEGAIPLETLFHLIQRKGNEPSIKTLEDLRSRFPCTDSTSFSELWSWKRRFITVEKDFEEITYQVLSNLHKQNVRYAEVIFAPGDCWREGLTIQGITEYVIKGKERAFRDFSIQSNLIVDLVRDRGPKRGMEILEEITPYLGKGLIGINLGGTEHRFPADPYATVYKKARERGFRLTAHAGEFAGALSIWAVVGKLGVERIGHGTRAYEDPKLVSLLKEMQIPLEMCVTSNVQLGVCRSIEEHPIREYCKEGLMVTINSDDPTMFNTSVTKELLILVQELGFSLDDLKRLSMNGIDASFMADGDKKAMKSQFDMEWKQILNKNTIK